MKQLESDFAKMNASGTEPDFGTEMPDSGGRFLQI